METDCGMDKAEKNAMDTEDSNSHARIKDTQSTWRCTAQGRVIGLKGITVNSVQLITGWTQHTDSVVVAVDSVFIQLYSCADSSGATRNSTMEFTQSVMALTTTRIIENTRRS